MARRHRGDGGGGSRSQGCAYAGRVQHSALCMPMRLGRVAQVQPRRPRAPSPPKNGLNVDEVGTLFGDGGARKFPPLWYITTPATRVGLPLYLRFASDIHVLTCLWNRGTIFYNFLVLQANQIQFRFYVFVLLFFAFH